jgi:hypothetical protein
MDNHNIFLVKMSKPNDGCGLSAEEFNQLYRVDMKNHDFPSAVARAFIYSLIDFRVDLLIAAKCFTSTNYASNFRGLI